MQARREGARRERLRPQLGAGVRTEVAKRGVAETLEGALSRQAVEELLLGHPVMSIWRSRPVLETRDRAVHRRRGLSSIRGDRDRINLPPPPNCPPLTAGAPPSVAGRHLLWGSPSAPFSPAPPRIRHPRVTSRTLSQDALHSTVPSASSACSLVSASRLVARLFL